MIEAFGGLDIFVVNAGHQQFREDVSEVSTDDFDATLKTNLYALHWLCRTAAPHMRPGVDIITTASIQAYEPSDLLYTERVGGPTRRRLPLLPIKFRELLGFW